MKEQKCENCGSRGLKFHAGVYTCEYCGSTFTPESGDGVADNYFNNFRIENDTLIRYYGHDDVVEIPDGITRVVEDAFRWKPLKALKCPPSLKRFDGTLVKCEKLECFEAPGLEVLPKELFSKNKTIKKVVLNSIKKIPAEAFWACESLREVAAPNVEEIGDFAFRNDMHLKSVIVPSVKIIGGRAFENCHNLVTAEFSSVEELSNYALAGCSKLTELHLPHLKYAKEHSVRSCSELKYIEAPCLKKIWQSAFSNCYALEKISFPQLQTIGEKAFCGCRSLREVNCPQATMQADERGYFNQFTYCPKLETLQLKEPFNKKKLLKEDKKNGCYIATAVYGSYDCPQVWTLRRYRDNTLASTWYGRMFVRTYYTISPILVKWFGNTKWFKKLWKGKLDKMITKLQAKGFESTPYKDKTW